MTTARLLELAQRIDRLVTDPDRVKAPFTRLARPILARLGWQPTVRVEAVQALLTLLKLARGPDTLNAEQLASCVGKAIEELDDNVVSVERTCVINRKAPVAHAAWLRRLHTVIARAHRAAEHLDDQASLRIATSVAPVMLLPPLALRTLPPADNDAGSQRSDDAGDADAAHDSSGADPARLLELQLGAVDHLITAASNEPEVLDRRRRLLEAARQVLLETAAALPLDPTAVETRRAFIAQEIVRVDRLQAIGLSPHIGLVHQARAAISRGDRARLHAALVALDTAALARGDTDMAARTGKALAQLWDGRDRTSVKATAYSQAQSNNDMFGGEVLDAIRGAYKTGLARLATEPVGSTFAEQEDARNARSYLAPGNVDATLAATMAVDGCFEVGGVLSPVRVTEQEIRIAAVRFPTQHLRLMNAQDPADIPDAVIEDPRSILLSLAAGRLLARRYIHEEVRTHTRTVLRGEVRVYVLDGSGSMMGPRARMRDAILVAELSTLVRRLSEGGRTTRVVLFYRYFDLVVHPTTRVDSAPTALAAIEDVLSNVRKGGTDIEAALVASFAQVREARLQDPELARAQIVLITDGEAPVREDLIRQAREGVEDLPVGVSVIALGQENPTLRELVAHERARGERAFYHYIDDKALRAVSEGTIDDGPALHLPASMRKKLSVAEEAADLERTVGSLVDELASLGRTRDVDALDSLDFRARAFGEMGIAETTGMTEGDRARLEAMHRDKRALSARFARWFPPAAKAEARGLDLPAVGSKDRDDFEAALVALATVAEVISVVGGSELARQADAIDVLERLLPDARLTPARFEAVVRAYPEHIRAALGVVHAAISRTASPPPDGTAH